MEFKVLMIYIPDTLLPLLLLNLKLTLVLLVQLAKQQLHLLGVKVQ